MMAAYKFLGSLLLLLNTIKADPCAPPQIRLRNNTLNNTIAVVLRGEAFREAEAATGGRDSMRLEVRELGASWRPTQPTDLRDRFATGVAIEVSPPVVGFKETVAGQPSAD